MHRPTLTQRGERQAIGWGAIGGFRAFARAHRLSFDLEWPKRKGGKGIMRNSRENSLRLSAVAAAGGPPLFCFSPPDREQTGAPQVPTARPAIEPSARHSPNLPGRKEFSEPGHTAPP